MDDVDVATTAPRGSRTERIQFRTTPELKARVNAVRGDEYLTAWVERAIEQRLFFVEVGRPVHPGQEKGET